MKKQLIHMKKVHYNFFIVFSDDLKEEEETDKIRQSLNLNASFCLITQKKFDEALGYLNEALRIDKNNLKTL